MPQQKEKKFTLPRDAKIALGRGGEQFVSAYNDEESRIDDLKIQDYRRMLDNDGQIQMIWSAITNTILSAGIIFNDDPEIDSEEPSEELEFIKNLLTSPPWKGGMKKGISHVSSIQLRALLEGYRVFEAIYKVNDEGKIILEKLAPRAATNDSDFKILVDDFGEFVGFRQRISFKNQLIDKSVRNGSGAKKAYKVTYGEEFGSNYGRSPFRSIWYHYDKAHKGMFINHVGHEKGALKVRYLRDHGAGEQLLNDAVERLERAHLEQVISLPNAMLELETLELTDSAVMEVGRESINFHYSVMAKALLVQFIDLGSNISETGSRATSQSQIEFFKQGVQWIGTKLIEDPWNEIIADLVRLNFNRGIYPTIKVGPIADDRTEALLGAFLEMVKKDTLPDVVKNQLVEQSSEELGIDVTVEEIAKEMEEKQLQEEKKLEQETANNMEMAKMKVAGPINNSDVNLLEDSLNTTVPMRSLFKDEEKVKLVDIKRAMDSARDEGERILTSKLIKQKEAIIDQYMQALRDGFKSISKVNIQLQESNENTYSEELTLILTGLFDYGKAVAAGELNRSTPSTPKQSLDAFQEKIKSIIGKQSGDLQFRLQSVANGGLDQGIPENEIRIRLEAEYDAFWEQVINPTLGANVSEALNRGRKVSFDRYSGEIFAFRYSAILDRNTTDYCRSLDGRVFAPNDANFALLTPPNHFGCRSIWTPILPNETDGVVITGKPTQLPTFSSISTFRDTPTSLNDFPIIDSNQPVVQKSTDIDKLIELIG